MSLYKWWKRIHGFIFPVCVEDIIFGIYNPQQDQAINTLNYCILYGKYYIYCTKSNGDKIFLFNFLHLLKNKLDILYTQHCIKNKVLDFMSRWSLIYENVKSKPSPLSTMCVYVCESIFIQMSSLCMTH